MITSIAGDEFVDPACGYGDCNRLRNLTGRSIDDVVIPPLEGRVLFVDFAFDSLEEAPDSVLHHLFAQAAAGPPRPGSDPR